MFIKYEKQTKLMLDCLPICLRNKIWALKGGTAINFFYKDLPRLSVDIDLTYLPIKGRNDSLEEITTSLLAIKKVLETSLQNISIQVIPLRNSDFVNKLIVNRANSRIKIEPNQIMRGTIYDASMVEPTDLLKTKYSYFTPVRLQSLQEICAGKICAALDRQHPRDFIDIKSLNILSGVSVETIAAVVVYMLGSSRPVYELLNPGLNEINGKTYVDIQQMLFDNSYISGIDELYDIRKKLINKVNNLLLDNDKKFILSFIETPQNPNWRLFTSDVQLIDRIKSLPWIKWKQKNLIEAGVSVNYNHIGMVV